MKNKLTVFLVTTSLLISSATVVSGSHWSTGSINRLVSHGVLNDDINIEEIFANPNKEITRENFFYLMVSSLYGEQAEVMDHENFGDFSQVTKELTGYIVKAYEEGILFGVEADGKININPNAIITRQDAAAILGRALKFSSTGSPTFSDNMNIADYAKGYVAVAQEMGILNGYTDGSFKPLNSITWGEAVTIFASMVEDDAKTFSDKKELYAGTTTKGYIDEALLLAEFNNVKGISLGSNGSIYVADSGNNLIRVIKEGKVSTFSG
ncbi:MAG: S-layer homology domain-containing protein, partial [Anaerotignaceae bacterium]